MRSDGTPACPETPHTRAASLDSVDRRKVLSWTNGGPWTLSFEITEALAKRKSPKDALASAVVEWDKITERRGLDKQRTAWVEKMNEMKALGIEYQPDWALKAK